MRARVGALALVLAAGCAVDDRSPPAAAKPRVAAASRPALAAPSAAAPVVFPSRKGTGMAPPMILRDYQRFAEVAPPVAQGGELLALRPEGIDHKVVAWALKRQMRLTHAAPGARSASLRLVTPSAGPELEAALVARLRAAGWLGASQGWSPRLVHPRLGQLEIDVKVPAERVTRVEFRLSRPDDAGPLEAPESLVARPPWLAAWPVAPVGYEVAHWHDRPPHEGPTDLQVLSALLPGQQPAVPRAAVVTQLEAAGFKADADGVWVRGAATVAFADRPGGLLVVSQVYSKRAPASAAPAISGSSAPPR